MSLAIWYGAKVGVATLGVASFATYMVNSRSASFRNFASINGKVSIPLIVAMFTTSAVTELAIQDAKNYPEKWDGGEPVIHEKLIAPEKVEISSLPYYKQALLKIYDHPIPFAATLALPLAGNIMHTRFSKSHLTLSQALMQTRVFAQFGVISILMTTMSIRFFVEYNNHFGFRQKHMTDEDRYARGWSTSPSKVKDAN